MNNTVVENAFPPAGDDAVSKPWREAAGRVCRRIIGKCSFESDVWTRAALLFLVLCAIKAVMLVGFRKSLFEIHWRVSSPTFDWTNHAAFYVFAALVGLNLWMVASRCRMAGVRTVRAANLCVLVMGAAFIFFTFHEGDKNYLAPVVNGVLKWTSIGSYMSLNLFFRPPFLAGWIVAYAFVYYGLVRSGRESNALFVTAMSAAIYTAICLADLVKYRDALICADCLGVACLVAAWRRKGVVWGWISWLPVVLCGTAFLFFRSLTLELSHLRPEFQILAGTTAVLFLGAFLFSWRRHFLPAWACGIPFALSAFLLLTNINYGMARNYDNLLCYAFMLPHYFLSELLLAIALVLFGILYRTLRPAGSLLWMDFVCVMVIALAIIDLRLSQIMGVRLDWQVLAFADSPKMMWRMAKPYLAMAFLTMALLAGLYFGIARYLRRPRFAAQAAEWGESNGLELAGVAFLLLALCGHWLCQPDKAEGQSAALLAQTSPWWKKAVDPPMSAESFKERALQLGFNQMFARSTGNSTGPSRDLNVVVIFQESTYNKHMSLFGSEEETQPLLSTYKDRMELFPNFFSDYAGSIFARFATFTGLYPVRDFNAFTKNRVPVKSLFDVLSEKGYDCSMFYSSFIDYTGFRDFLRGRGLSKIYDADTMPGQRKTPPVSWGLREEETLGAIQNQIRKYATNGQKFFLTYVPAAPHYPYDSISDRFRRYKPTDIGDYSPLYKNELLYMDWVIASIVDELKTTGLLDKTLVVITSDHGEMLGGKDGNVGHGWAITPELANVPLIIMDPGRKGFNINPAIGSQVDLLPTVLDVLGIPLPSDQLYQGESLLSQNADLADRVIYLNSFEQYGILTNREFVCASRRWDNGGVAELQKTYALSNTAARSFFVEEHNSNPTAVPAISEFDDFQENFLRHYSYYQQLARRPQFTRR